MQEYSRTKNSTLNFVTGIGGEFLATALRFVTRTVFIYTLGVQYLGIGSLFVNILAMLSLTELGIDTALNYKLYKPLAERNDKRVRVLLKFYRQAYQVIGSIILLLGLCLIPVLPYLIKDFDSLSALNINAGMIFVLYLLQSVSSYLFFAYRSVVMRANQKKYVLEVAEYAVMLVGNLTQILILILTHNYVLYTSAYVGYYVMRNYVDARIAQHYYPQFFIPEKESLKREEVWDMLKDCGALFLYKLNNVVVKATDNLVLSAFIGLASVGLYSNYLLLFTTINRFFDKMHAAIVASSGNLFAVSDIPPKYRFFLNMNFITVLLYGTAASGVAVCADELITVWIGRDYLITPYFAVLVGIELLFCGMVSGLEQIRQVSGVFRQLWFRPLLSILTNLGVSIWLVKSLGIHGIILGTITSAVFVGFLVDPFVVYKYSFENYRPVSEYYKKNLFYLGILSAVTAFDIWLCSRLLSGVGWFSLILHALVVVLTVPGALLLICWRSPECQYLVKLSLSIVRKIYRKNQVHAR